MKFQIIVQLFDSIRNEKNTTRTALLNGQHITNIYVQIINSEKWHCVTCSLVEAGSRDLLSALAGPNDVVPPLVSCVSDTPVCLVACPPGCRSAPETVSCIATHPTYHSDCSAVVDIETIRSLSGTSSFSNDTVWFTAASTHACYNGDFGT